MIYALTNPVADHLVEKIHHWPGVESLCAIENRVPLVASKPPRFFDKDNEALPVVVTLDLIRPPGTEHIEHLPWIALLRERVAAVEDRAAADRAANGASVLGRRAVRKQHWRDRPSTREPRRELSPRVACSDKWRRIEALQRNRAFVDAYRQARLLFVAGHAACFPSGTYWLAKYAGVPCDPATSPPT